jgi:pyruvate formate lyase activating enzyme
MKSSEEQNICSEKNIEPRSNATALECKESKGLIMNIQDLSFQDGPGIRTTIFLKGCPLKCHWCSNPEGQNILPEIMHNEILCKKSYVCKSVCPHNAININNDNYPDFDREKCKICETRDCVDACNNSALKIVGTYFTIDEILKKIIPNVRFYKNSGGGLTLSGGEPLAQPDFVKEIIRKSSEYNLSIGIETCGFFNWSEVEDFIDKFEFIYFDLKCIDEKSYLKFTGVNEKIILENLTKIANKNSSKIIITIPIIPNINDSAGMMKKVTGLCKNLGINKIRLLPYHSFGKGKYKDLGREYKFEVTRELNKFDLINMKEYAVNAGFECWVE